MQGLFSWESCFYLSDRFQTWGLAWIQELGKEPWLFTEAPPSVSCRSILDYVSLYKFRSRLVGCLSLLSLGGLTLYLSEVWAPLTVPSTLQWIVIIAYTWHHCLNFTINWKLIISFDGKVVCQHVLLLASWRQTSLNFWWCWCHSAADLFVRKCIQGALVSMILLVWSRII